jgi:hypothetical protein
MCRLHIRHDDAVRLVQRLRGRDSLCVNVGCARPVPSACERHRLIGECHDTRHVHRRHGTRAEQRASERGAGQENDLDFRVEFGSVGLLCHAPSRRARRVRCAQLLPRSPSAAPARAARRAAFAQKSASSPRTPPLRACALSARTHACITVRWVQQGWHVSAYARSCERRRQLQLHPASFHEQRAHRCVASFASAFHVSVRRRACRAACARARATVACVAASMRCIRRCRSSAARLRLHAMPIALLLAAALQHAAAARGRTRAVRASQTS